MLPQHETAVYRAAQTAAQNLMNNNVGHAYPQLVPVLQTMGHDVLNAFTQMLAAQREELFYGESPWAMLYTLQTGKKIAVPRHTKIIDNLAGDHISTRTPQVPFKFIMEYWEAHREKPEEGLEELVFNHWEPQHDQVVIDLKTKEAYIWWHESAMKLTLPKFWENRGFLSCPLFHEPYQVTIDMAYLQSMLFGPLYEQIVGEEHRPHEADPKYILMEKYFGTREAPLEGGETAFNQLRVLLDGHMFTKGNLGHATFDWKGFRIRLDSKRDWDFHAGNNIVYVGSISVPKEGVTDGYLTINNWKMNSLLVNDLLADFDQIVDQLLSEHELSMREAQDTPE